MAGSRNLKPLSGVLRVFLGREEQEHSLGLVTVFWLLHRLLNCLVIPGFVGSQGETLSGPVCFLVMPSHIEQRCLVHWLVL